MVFPFSICFYCVSFYTIIILSVCVSWNVIKCINYHYLLLQNTRTNLQIAYFDVKKNKPSEPKGFLFCFGFISDQFKREKKNLFQFSKNLNHSMMLHVCPCILTSSSLGVIVTSSSTAAGHAREKDKDSASRARSKTKKKKKKRGRRKKRNVSPLLERLYRWGAPPSSSSPL